MPVAFVTGGTGFVGRNLVEILRADGWDVVALCREPSRKKARPLEEVGATLAMGSILEPESLARGIPEGADAVFHVAGNTSMWFKGDEQQTRDNVVGTRNVVEAALGRSVGRFVHTSSIAAYGNHRAPVTEQTVSNALDSPINYHRTKRLAELEVLAGAERGLDPVLICPAHVMGPYDTHNWSQLFLLIDQGKLPGVPPGQGSFGHVREVAKAHLSAFHRGRSGESYILGGTEASFLEIANEIGELLGKPVPKRPTPAWLLQVIGRVSHWVSHLTGKEPDLTPEKVSLVIGHVLSGSDKAARELGYQHMPLRQILKDCHGWLREERLLSAA